MRNKLAYLLVHLEIKKSADRHGERNGYSHRGTIYKRNIERQTCKLDREGNTVREKALEFETGRTLVICIQ